LPESPVMIGGMGRVHGCAAGRPVEGKYPVVVTKRLPAVWDMRPQGRSFVLPQIRTQCPNSAEMASQADLNK